MLVDPKEHGIDIRHVSPCFIQQNGCAKHKRLEDCMLYKVCFIFCFNADNDVIMSSGTALSALLMMSSGTALMALIMM